MTILHYLKSEYQRLTVREVLALSVECLVGVTKGASEALAVIRIKTVFDLATTTMFKAAADALHTMNNGTRSLPALVSADLLDKNAKNATAGEFLDQSIKVFRGINAKTADTIENEIGVKLVRDLATWPPYLAAKAILNEAYGLPVVGVLDSEYPDDLVPGSGRYPTERIQYEVLVFDRILAYRREAGGALRLTKFDLKTGASKQAIGRDLTRAFKAESLAGAQTDGSLYRLEEAGPIDVSVAASPEYGFQHPAIGAVLTYNQSWYTQGLALGQLLHTVALAPGESTRLAMIDWHRRSRSATGEEISQTEALSNELVRARSIREVTSAVAREAQQGFSKSTTDASSEQFGLAGGVAGVVAPGAVAGAGAAYGTASSTATSQSWANSSGERSLNAEMSQNVMDRTHQAASSARNRRATIVREVSQEESEQISTRAVTNYNHMHALSIEYFEIVQLYRVAVELARVSRCLFIPMKVLTFDTQTARRFRSAFASGGLIPSVRALSSIEPNHIAVVAPHRVKPWSRLKDMEIVTGEVVGTPESSAIILPKYFAKRFAFGFWENAPIDQVAITFTSGETITLGLHEEEPGIRRIPKFIPSTGDMFDRDKKGRDFSEITRIEFIKKSGNIDYESDVNFSLSFFGDFPENFGDIMGVSLQATIHVPKDASQFTAFEFTESIADNELIKHLNDNALYYSQVVWRSLDSATIALLLSPYTLGSRPVIEVIDPLPIATAGNYLVFRMYPEADDTGWEAFKKKHNLTPGVVREDIVPLPSGGVFAEAVLGRANSAEKIDLTRFWNWQDSPIPLVAPEIAAIQSGSRAQPDNTTPGQLDAPVVNIVNPPSLPDPTGLSAALQAIQNGNMFRDMSGLAATIGLTQAALSRTSDAARDAAAQAGQNMATAADLFRSMQTTPSGGGTQSGGTTSPPAAPNTVTNLGGTLEQARQLDNQETQSNTVQTGQPAPPVQRRQEKVLRITEPQAETSPAGQTPGDILPLVPLSNIPLDPGNGGRSIGPAALEVGDIILSTTTALPSRIIRAGTGSPVSHSILYIGGSMIVEAIAEGVVMRPIQQALSDASFAVALRYQGLTPQQALRIRDFAGRQIGKPYDYRYGVFQQALFRLDLLTMCAGKTGEDLSECRLWVGRLNIGTGTNDKWFCSELVTASYADAGVPLTTTPPAWNAPEDIVQVSSTGMLGYVGHLKTW